jgi:hypothetical protein
METQISHIRQLRNSPSLPMAAILFPFVRPISPFRTTTFYSFNFAYKLLKQKLTATATVTNFLEKERKFKFLTENQNFITENRNEVLFRNFGLALNL